MSAPILRIRHVCQRAACVIRLLDEVLLLACRWHINDYYTKLSTEHGQLQVQSSLNTHTGTPSRSHHHRGEGFNCSCLLLPAACYLLQTQQQSRNNSSTSNRSFPRKMKLMQDV